MFHCTLLQSIPESCVLIILGTIVGVSIALGQSQNDPIGKPGHFRFSRNEKRKLKMWENPMQLNIIENKTRIVEMILLGKAIS